jgi:hypothetical protein
MEAVLLMLAIGALGGVFSGRLRTSGLLALGLAAVPPAGLLLTFAFC